MTVDIRCPKCGAMQYGLYLDETKGKFICSNCQEEAQVPLSDSTTDKIPVVFVTNEGYAPYLSTAIYSLIANRNPSIHYILYIFYSSLSSKSIDLLSALQEDGVEIKFINFEEELRAYESLFRTHSHYTKESYYRIFIPKYFGPDFGRIIYLDVDLIVNCDVSEILAEADRGKTINAAPNYSTEEDAAYIASLGLSPENYFNAGIMTIDCRRFNENGYFEKAIKCMEERRSYIYIDQDVLNQVCEGDIGLLDAAWNVQWNNLDHMERFIPQVRKTIEEIKRPRIVHYTIQKPWKIMLNRYGEYYRQYAERNPVYKQFFG